MLLTPDGFVADGSTSSIAWWRGHALAIPAPEIGRVDGVIVTGWVDGPTTAEEPGRLEGWRRRLAALRHPLPDGPAR